MRRCDNCKRNLFCDSIWKTSGDRVTSCVSWTPIITNADKIRTMTDKELAKLITDDWCEILGCSSYVCGGDCESMVLDWLRQEVQDEEDFD